MISREIDVEVVASTFPGKTVPSELAGPAPASVNITESLLMLGQMTSPSGFSIASPARYWAWLRYFSAIHSTTDLRITAPFIDLDPHQKTILSDDLGVGITVRWLHERLGGFAEIVDGRRFMLQYASLLKQPAKKKRKAPKVGYGKCPDFVIKDYSGKWHVIECKGTQTSHYYRNSQMTAALAQKKVIDVVGPVKGHRLALGLYLGNERGSDRSHLKVVDPKVEPYITVNETGAEHAENAMSRLAASRALALSGFDDLAEELSLPLELDRFGPEELRAYFTSEERRRLTRPVEERWDSAMKSLRAAPQRVRFDVGSDRYTGLETEIAIAGDAFKMITGFNRVRVTQGANLEFIDQLRHLKSDFPESVGDVASNFLSNSRVEFLTQGTSTTLVDGNLFAARLEFLQ